MSTPLTWMLRAVKAYPDVYDKLTGSVGYETVRARFPTSHEDMYKPAEDEVYMFGGQVVFLFGSEGFLYAGRILVSPLMPAAVKVVDCVNCRKWATTEGAGELAMKRLVSAETKLDPTPPTWQWDSSILHFMEINQDVWVPHAKHISTGV